MNDLTKLTALKDLTDTIVQGLTGVQAGLAELIAAETPTTDPGPTDPGPTDPGPVDPGPVDPGPVAPGPVEPGPVDPGPVTTSDRLEIPPSAVIVTAKTLAVVISGGATDVVLPAAEYGVLAIDGAVAPNVARIWFSPGAHADRIAIGGGSKNLILMAPCVWPDKVVCPPNTGIISANTTTESIAIHRADVRGHVSGADYAMWTLAEWKTRERFGIVLEGKDSVIHGCRGLGLRIAWTIKGERSAVLGNVALGLSEDGSRIVGNGVGMSSAGNYYGDFITTTGGARHPDGIVQAWSKLGSAKPGAAGMLTDMMIRNNVCVERIQASGAPGLFGLAPDHPFRIAPQGIGLHDGSYSDVDIRGNRVWTTAWTGMNVNLKSGSGAVIKDNEFYDLLGRKDHAKVTTNGSGIIESGNIASQQNYGSGQRQTSIDYAKAPKPPAPPAWDQWAA